MEKENKSGSIPVRNEKLKADTFQKRLDKIRNQGKSRNTVASDLLSERDEIIKIINSIRS